MEKVQGSKADDVAWGPAIRTYNHRVMMSVVALGIPLARAQELTQITWARLIEKRRAGQLDRLELPGVALKQARFLAIDDLRRNRTETEAIAQIALASRTLHDAEDPEQRLISRDQLEKITAVIAASPQTTRRVFAVFYSDPSRPHKEIAVEVGISVQRVRQILCEVRRELRNKLEKGSW